MTLSSSSSSSFMRSVPFAITASRISWTSLKRSCRLFSAASSVSKVISSIALVFFLISSRNKLTFVSKFSFNFLMRSSRVASSFSWALSAALVEANLSLYSCKSASNFFFVSSSMVSGPPSSSSVSLLTVIFCPSSSA